ncbi:TrmH family RNA methyltransferase [Gorillibacterium timonense]|uniref:TrmH family RNA methyltransferase n=1 Tax=Gorillibacterium timonense TaxID=1689269 RepID=UPI00071D1C00|nr:RNA methyltransferase [Gorillibacterium timonense]
MNITSVQNPRVKEWSELTGKKGRDKQGRFLLEGIHLIQEALHAGVAVRTVLYDLEKGLSSELEPLLADAPQIELVGVSAAVLAKCSETETPQGALAIADKPSSGLKELLADPAGFVVALDGLQDPGNVGTIIRTADAAGAAGVIVGKGSADPYAPKTVRSTMGSLFHLPVVEAALAPLLEEATARGVQVYSTGMASGLTCYDADFTAPVWFVIGNEGRGVSPEVRALVQQELSIPMPGQAESLNAAMAAGILLYEAVRQRGFK